MHARVFAIVTSCLGALGLLACKQGGDSGTTTQAQPASSRAPASPEVDKSAWRKDLSKICGLPSAAPESLQQRLGLKATVKPGAPSPFSATHTKCVYHMKPGQLAIEVEVQVRDLKSARRTFEQMVGPTKDYPGFGDEAFLISVPAGAESLNSLAVRKGDIMIIMNSGAPPDTMRSVLVSLFAEMGVQI
jgi:hypothetical protein